MEEITSVVLAKTQFDYQQLSLVVAFCAFSTSQRFGQNFFGLDQNSDFFKNKAEHFHWFT